MRQNQRRSFFWIKAIKQCQNYVQELSIIAAIFSFIVLSLEFIIRPTIASEFFRTDYPLFSVVSVDLLYYLILSFGCIIILYLHSGVKLNTVISKSKKNVVDCFIGFILLDAIIESPDLFYIIITQNIVLPHILYTLFVTGLAVWLYCRFCFFLYFLVHQNVSVLKSFHLSFQLTRDHVYEVLLMLFLPMLMMLLVYASTIYIINLGSFGISVLQTMILTVLFPMIVFAHVEFAEQYKLSNTH